MPFFDPLELFEGQGPEAIVLLKNEIATLSLAMTISEIQAANYDRHLEHSR